MGKKILIIMGLILITIFSGCITKTINIPPKDTTLNTNGPADSNWHTAPQDFVPAENSTTFFRIRNNAGTTIFNANTTNKRIGLNTEDPLQALHVIGTIQVASGEADATTKSGNLRVSHYTNAEKAIQLIGAIAALNNNTVQFGGGNPAINAATKVNFWTAANTTTLKGTQRMTIIGSGRIGVNETNADAMMEIVTNAATEEGLKVKGRSGQTGDLIIATTNTDQIGFKVESDFDITIGRGAPGKDYVLKFYGQSSDGEIIFMEDENRFDFENSAHIEDNLSFDGSLTSSGSAGITDSTSYWLCVASNCSTTCQVTIKTGIITGCV